jgi:hypothetical protein
MINSLKSNCQHIVNPELVILSNKSLFNLIIKHFLMGGFMMKVIISL